MTLNLTNTVFNFLKKNPTKKFTAREIAQWIFENYPEKCCQKQKRSTAIISPLHSDAALIQQIVAEIGSLRSQLQKRYPELKPLKDDRGSIILLNKQIALKLMQQRTM